MDKATQANIITGAPGTLSLNGRTFLVGQPTPADARSVGMFLKKKARSPVAILEADPDFALLPEEEQKRRKAQAAQQKFENKDGIDPLAAFDLLCSLEGCRFLAWVLIRKNHPEVRLEDFVPLITEANYLGVFMELDLASGMEQLGNLAGQSGSPTKAE